MQKAKPGLLVTSVKTWFKYSSPPASTSALHSATAALPQSAIQLITSALQHLRQTSCVLTKRYIFLNFKVMYKGFNFSLRQKFYFQICHCSCSFVSFTVRKHTDTPCSVLKQEPTICISVLAEALVEQRHLKYKVCCILSSPYLYTRKHVVNNDLLLLFKLKMNHY